MIDDIPEKPLPNNLSGEEEPRIPEKLILPVSKESVDAALLEIAQDPKKALADEGVIMEKQNPLLFTELESFKEVAVRWGFYYSDYVRGAYWTHKILRKQAEMCGRQLPTISLDLLDSFSRDSTQHNIEQEEKKKPTAIQEELQQTTAQDYEFTRAIEELIKYKSSSSAFCLGALDVYGPMRNALQSEELNKTLKF